MSGTSRGGRWMAAAEDDSQMGATGHPVDGIRLEPEPPGPCDLFRGEAVQGGFPENRRRGDDVDCGSASGHALGDCRPTIA